MFFFPLSLALSLSLASIDRTKASLSHSSFLPPITAHDCSSRSFIDWSPPPIAALAMGSSSGAASRGEGESTGELVSTSSSTSSSSSSTSSLHSSPRLPSLPLLPPLPTLPSPRSIASAVSDSGDAARRHVQLALRTIDFWRRATGIYLAYKGKQAQEAALKSRALSALVPGSKPWDKERLEEELWKPHHEWAGKEMYELAVSVRGFYLKVRELVG